MNSVEHRDAESQECRGNGLKTTDADELHQRRSEEREANGAERGGGAGCSSEPPQLPPLHASWPRRWEPPPGDEPVSTLKDSLEKPVLKDAPFSCSVCTKSFRFKSALKKHGLVHSGEKPHSCAVCGKGFQFVSDLRKHALIHSGERPYSCSVCGKGFVDVSNFRRHERIHTGEKPFSCPFCDKDFTDKGNVKKHLRVHTGEKPFSCSVCKKEFSFLASYKRHVRIHRGVTAETQD